VKHRAVLHRVRAGEAQRGEHVPPSMALLLRVPRGDFMPECALSE